ncbi:HpcH/HpaI aldolase/citrate lyase family [Halarchaeum acidiphilum MH1-52-1]|uniref:HpcH/HpaI aldolase/citrate lyase family n=1 Tax=Halarchaeum acidiphilum MH1-52-1 TaxID=1261545 RepID=U2YUM7_9EURY|nr:CoA ester lyase [Halarchaeum acidiphilum]GAD52725.1 HpcH/HpaI aldolase/citrate lyase family [Halarchaeum acidiphilum MH1-52-1]
MEFGIDYLLRSQLATPANSTQMIDDALESDADQVFFDLEDSLHASEKADARASLVEAVRTREWGETPLSYRINSVRTRWWYEDVIEVVTAVGTEIESLIVPKVREPADLRTVETLLESVETNAGLEPGGIDLLVQVEDAAGMGNVEEIVHATDRLGAVIFGPGDYSASIESKGHVLGADSDYPGHYWHYPLSRISHAAASVDVPAIDGLYTNVEDVEGFRESCRYARMLGFDGKWVIHPAQTAAANELFAPADEEVDRARTVIETYETAAPGEVPTEDGRVVDEETVEMARHILRKAELAGVDPSR